MDPELKDSLIRCETDVSGALARFMNNEVLYVLCLQKFLQDETMEELDSALKARSWDDAFTAVHALKGVAGNMGFLPLLHAAANMVVLIRAGKTDEVDRSYMELKRCYEEISLTIRPYVDRKGDGK